MDGDLFLVTGKGDFVADDDGDSIILCRSCFEADQDMGVLGHLAADTFVFKASPFLPAEKLECEGHRCCEAHHGPGCALVKKAGFNCEREHQYDEWRAKVREKLQDVVMRHRITRLEGIAAVIVNALGWVAAWMIWTAIKSDTQALLGPVFSWGFWILAAVAVTLGSRSVLHGTIRKKIRLAK